MSARPFAGTSGRCLGRMLAILIVAVATLLPPTGRAQAPGVGAIEDTLLFTVGTTTVDGQGRDMAYLLWQASAVATIRDRQFAVYRKDGVAGSANPYALEGVVTGNLSSPILSANLLRAERLGQDMEMFDDSLEAFAFTLGLTLAGDRAERTGQVLQAAKSQTGMSNAIYALASSSPGLALGLGEAWTGTMPPGISTYEIREWDPVACVDRNAVGRITLEAGVVVPLPAPGTPVQVPDGGNTGDRSVSLRWSAPDDLRRRTLLTHGFNLWRLPWADAVALGWDAAAPTTAGLLAAVGGGAVESLNDAPVFPNKRFTDAEAVDFVTDPSTFFFTDNNGHFDTPPGPRHPDGAEFGYIATARDLLGRNGAPSAAGYGRACRTVAPLCPAGFAAAVHYDEPALPGKQLVRLVWDTVDDPNDDVAPATRYEVFRGVSQEQLNAPGGGLDPLNLVADIPRQPGLSMSFDDLSFNQNGHSEEEYYGTSFWYVVRAVYDGPCGSLHSAACPPTFATLCDHSPPAAPVGGVSVVSCPQPVAIYDAATGITVADDAPTPNGEYHFRLVCTRRDVGVEWVEFEVEASAGPRPLGRFVFADESDTVEVELTLTPLEADPVYPLPQWRCQVGNGEEHVSNVAQFDFRPDPSSLNDRLVLPFVCGALSPGTTDVSDPLAAPLLTNNGVVAGADAPDRDGWVVVPGLTPAAEYVMMYESTIETVTVDWGVADATGTLVFFDPALGTLTPSEAGTGYRAWRFNRPSPCPPDPPHQAIDPRTGRLAPIRLCVPKNPAALEYRLFRRIDGGPLTLFAQGRVTTTPGPICRSDDSLVAHGACITYFAQFIGRNGASSALSELGCHPICVKPPSPVLSPPQPVGDAANPKVELHWSCPPQGVDRFAIFMAPVNGSKLPSNQVSAASAFLKSVIIAKQAPVVGGGLFVVSPAQVKFRAFTGVTKYLAMEEKLLTPRIGTGGIGDGPEFTLTIPVTLGQEYKVSVAAIATGGTCTGTPSLQYSVKWEPPPQLADRSVPWPSRPLPSTGPDPSGKILALPLDRFTGLNYTRETLYPADERQAAAGVRIGFMPNLDDPAPTIGDMGEFQFEPYSLPFDPHYYLEPRPGGGGKKCLPAVLYRQQVANATWPVVSGDVLQVSPLVRQLEWSHDALSTHVPDPFLAVQKVRSALPVVDGETYVTTYEFFLLDTTPLVRGASYRYWLVCFSDAGEPESVVTSDPITIPLSPP